MREWMVGMGRIECVSLGRTERGRLPLGDGLDHVDAVLGVRVGVPPGGALDERQAQAPDVLS